MLTFDRVPKAGSVISNFLARDGGGSAARRGKLKKSSDGDVVLGSLDVSQLAALHNRIRLAHHIRGPEKMVNAFSIENRPTFGDVGGNSPYIIVP